MTTSALDTWESLRAHVIERDGSCVASWLLGGPCSNTLHVHHIVPREEGGSDDPENLVALCGRHHPMAEAIRRAILRRRPWRSCPHPHRTREGREACERRLNRAA